MLIKQNKNTDCEKNWVRCVEYKKEITQNNQPVKVAVLDSGIDSEKTKIKVKYKISFTNDKNKDS